MPPTSDPIAQEPRTVRLQPLQTPGTCPEWTLRRTTACSTSACVLLSPSCSHTLLLETAGGWFYLGLPLLWRYVYYPERDCVSALWGHPDLISPMALSILCVAFGHNLYSTFSQGTEAHIRFSSVFPTYPFPLHLSKLYPFLQLKSIPRPRLTRSILAQSLPMCSYGIDAGLRW